MQKLWRRFMFEMEWIQEGQKVRSVFIFVVSTLFPKRFLSERLQSGKPYLCLRQKKITNFISFLHHSTKFVYSPSGLPTAQTLSTPKSKLKDLPFLLPLSGPKPTLSSFPFSFPLSMKFPSLPQSSESNSSAGDFFKAEGVLEVEDEEEFEEEEEEVVEEVLETLDGKVGASKTTEIPTVRTFSRIIVI